MKFNKKNGLKQSNNEKIILTPQHNTNNNYGEVSDEP